jgi:hypothetical protein
MMRYPKPKILLGGWLRLFNQRTITSHQTGAVLLRRFHVVQWGGPDGPGVMLHQFFGPDEGRCLHDHPWPFVSLILAGGYIEQIRESETLPVAPRYVIRERWSWRRLCATDRHRIIHVDPGTWSLVLHGRKERTWGFHTPAGWVAWDDYGVAVDDARTRGLAGVYFWSTRDGWLPKVPVAELYDQRVPWVELYEATSKPSCWPRDVLQEDVPIVLREDPVAPIAVEVEPGRLHALDLWADRRWDVT